MTPLTTIARGDASRIVDRRRTIVRDADEWTALWAAHAGPEADPPAIDFASTAVAAAFAGERPTPGYSVEITGAVEEDGGVSLVVDERAPRTATVAAQILTSPFHIVSLPRSVGDIRWMHPADRRVSHGRRERAASATGLKPTTAAVLAYLAGPLSGAIMLFAEPADRYVRFHAWQAVIGLGGLALAMIACYVLAFASLFVSANAVATMVNAAMVVAIVMAIVWLFCLWKAFTGPRRWKLPVVGGWAERLVERRAR